MNPSRELHYLQHHCVPSMCSWDARHVIIIPAHAVGSRPASAIIISVILSVGRLQS